MNRPVFVRYGSTRHLRIAGAEDLRHVLTLTRTRWIATAAPISAFDLDQRFLERLDSDRDRRVLPYELRAAIEWTLGLLADVHRLDAGSGDLDEASINPGHPDGERIIGAVRLARSLRGGEEAAVTRADLDAAMTELTRRSADEEQACRPPEAFTAIRKKVDEFFFLSRAAASAGRPAPYDGPLTAALETLDAAAVRAALDALPLAPPSPDGLLPLVQGLNPVYEPAVARFRAEIVEPVLGRVETLDEPSWRAIAERYTPAAVAGQYAGDVAAIDLAIRLSLFQEHLVRFANSYVSCPDLYHPDRHAAFEAGTLYLGGYAYTFAVKVANRPHHVEIARSSNIFVVYAAVFADGPPAFEIAVPVTSGTGRRIFRGKHGVFLDTRGREWHAQVVEIVTSPVSLMEAAVGPFRRLGEVLTGRIEAITKEAEANLDKTAAEIIPSPAAAPAAPPPPAAPPARTGFLGGAGAIAGAGVAVAALTSALAFITSALSGVPWWHIIIGVAAAIGVVMVPALVSALIKLSRRDLSVILEGTTWAMNSPLRLTRRQGRFFTRKAPKRRRLAEQKR